MNIIETASDFVDFNKLRLRRMAWGKLSNALVALHVKLTPKKATEDTFREIVLEQIRYRQRKVEQIRHSLWLQMGEIAEKRNIKSSASVSDLEEIMNGSQHE